MLGFDRDKFDERFGVWAMAALTGTVLGTVARMLFVGRTYSVYGVSTGGLGLVGAGGLFCVLSRGWRARLGWGFVVAAATVAGVVPIGTLGRAGWWAQVLATLAGAVLVGLGARLQRSAVVIAAALLVATIAARVISLRWSEGILGTASVLSGQ